MNIVYTIISLENSGGVERVVVNKANWLVDHDHQVSIVTNYGARSFYKLDSRVRVVCLNLNKKKEQVGCFLYRKFNSYVYKLQHALRLKKTLVEIKPDVISSIHSDDFYILPFVHGKCKYIFEYHFVSSANEGKDNRIISMLHDYVMSMYNAVVFLTKSETDNHTGCGNVFHISNFNVFNNIEQASLINQNVIAVGNLIPLKGFERLIFIWKSLQKDCPNWTLQIFGDGPERNHLQHMIDSYGLTDVVKLMGKTDDIQSKYLESSIMVSASCRESFSMVILEAQSVGLPCVAFDCPYGPREIIQDKESGYLIPMDDDLMFEKILIRLMNDNCERQRVGQNAIANSRRFDIDVIMNQWVRLFKSI